MKFQGPIVPSDSLASLRELFIGTPQLAKFFAILPQLRLVIDSNLIIGDLIWLTQKRQKEFARTSLQEVIASGMVIAFAPNKLREEIEEHLPELAVEKGIPIENLRKEWIEYQKYLRFCDSKKLVGESERQVVDPDDLPFIYLYGYVGAAAVVSRDHHILAMGAPTVTLDVIIHLRDYARAKSVEVTIMFGGGIAASITIESVLALVKSASKLFMRLPKWMQLSLVVGAGILILHPDSRAAINKYLSEASKKLHIALAELKPLLAEVSQALQTESTKVKNSLTNIRKALPPQRRVSLKIIARSVCIAAGAPLTLSEIERRVFLNGYETKSRYFRIYLRRVMNNDQSFIQLEDGRWKVT